MEKEKFSSQNMKRILSWLIIVVAIAWIAVVCGQTILRLRQELYDERAYNSGRIMDKISANIQTVLQGRFDDVIFDARLISQSSFDNVNEVAEYIGKLEEMGKTEYGEDILFMIDSEGGCLASDGTMFEWEESDILDSNKQEIMIDSVDAMGLSEEYMLFFVPLPRSVNVNERTFTHICLAMELSDMEVYLSRANYVDKSAIFIIHNDGACIYRQAENSVFSEVSNLITSLKEKEYHYDTTAEQTIYNIRSKVSGCACVEVDNVNYFVIHKSLEINDWTAVYLIPEDGIGSDSSSFMRSIILTIVVLAVIVMAVVLCFIFINHLRTMKQQAIINEQLQRAAQAERSANVAKTRFLSSMSHDIRTPMNAIIGMTTLAQKHIEDKGYVADCLTKIKLSSDHLLALINDILDISKIESGKMTLSPIVFSLAESVHNMFNIIIPQAKAKNQKFDFHIERIEHEYLRADELRLNQIFINILTNAIKYTPAEGKITATIHEEVCQDNPNNVRLTYIVQDNGIGMSEEFMENMYGSFLRATDTRVNKIQGSGLGLAICKQLVEMMDGTIECESAIGEGTKFTVTVTLEVANHPSDNYMLPKMKLLLVDDDDLFLKSAVDIFMEMGVEPQTALSGEDAIELVNRRHEQNNDYSVILVDWKLSGLDGIETTKRIHGLVGDSSKIILINAYDSEDIEDIEDTANDAGAVGFIRKPFFKASLYQQLSQYLEFPGESDVKSEETEFVGMRVLVAEDNDLNWEIVQSILEMYGISSERAENGKLCVDRLLESEDGQFDIVLMDIQMPVMNGKDAAREIRKAQRGYVRDIPIIAMTADAFAEDVAACMEAGMNGHVPKPIDLEKLFYEFRKIRNKM